MLAVGTGAVAHEQLADSHPGEGETLSSPPSEVALTFTADVLPIAPIILIRDAAGRVVQDDEPDVAGNVVSVPIGADLADGAYLVVWRVVSSDGHPIEGTVAFSIERPTAPGPDPTSGSPEPAVTATTSSPGPDDDPEPDSPDLTDDATGPFQPVTVLALGVAAVATVLVVLARRRRR